MDLKDRPTKKLNFFEFFIEGQIIQFLTSFEIIIWWGKCCPVVPWLMGPDTRWSRELSHTFQMTRQNLLFFIKKIVGNSFKASILGGKRANWHCNSKKEPRYKQNQKEENKTGKKIAQESEKFQLPLSFLRDKRRILRVILEKCTLG